MKQKLSTYFAEHEGMLQFVKFTLISMIAGLSETVSFLILSNLLPAVGINSEVNWFVFRYAASAGGMGAMIAFLVSATIGQVISFVINFKKTFKSTNNVVASAIGYAIMAIIIIVGLNVYLGGLLNDALCAVMDNAALAGFLAKTICMMASFLIVFPMNKFVIMRSDPKKETHQDDKNNTQQNTANQDISNDEAVIEDGSTKKIDTAKNSKDDKSNQNNAVRKNTKKKNPSSKKTN